MRCSTAGLLTALLLIPPGNAEASGVVGTEVLHDGETVGSVDHDEINCLGHASGVGSAVYVGGFPLGNTLDGLGYACAPDNSQSLRGAIKSGSDVMMVYVHVYPPAWRTDEDRELTLEQLIDKYGWHQGSWREPFLFFDEHGHNLPIDYHAVSYDHAGRHWDWVSKARPKNPDGSYETDATYVSMAAHNPDLYFPSDRVLLSLACSR